MQQFQSDRAVEILTTPNKIHGTGYRIGGRLVLTCTHVFKLDETCKVKSKSIGVKSAEVIWKAPDGIDITLLELSEEVEPCPPISFGKLPETGNLEKLEFDFLGWPAWGFINSDNKDKATGLHIEGDIYLKDISALKNNNSKVRKGTAEALETIGSLTVLEILIQTPNINLFDDDIFPVARRLAIKHSKSGSPFIPLYPELISQSQH